MIRQNDPRRWKERADGSMIMEDHNAAANLSPDVKIKQIYHNDAPIDSSKIFPMSVEAVFMDVVQNKRGK